MRITVESLAAHFGVSCPPFPLYKIRLTRRVSVKVYAGRGGNTAAVCLEPRPGTADYRMIGAHHRSVSALAADVRRFMGAESEQG